MDDSIGTAGSFTVYQCDDGVSYYFEHDQLGEERAVGVSVDPETKKAFDYEGLFEIPAPCLEWLRQHHVDVTDVE